MATIQLARHVPSGEVHAIYNGEASRPLPCTTYQTGDGELRPDWATNVSSQAEWAGGEDVEWTQAQNWNVLAESEAE